MYLFLSKSCFLLAYPASLDNIASMCELLGMSANVPTDICFSFSGLMERGGRTGPHKDGWGIAFYEDGGHRSFHDPHPSCKSELADLISHCSIKSEMVVSHIRKATHGRVCLENTHPFQRELWGRPWTFAHNGKLKGIKKRKLEFYRPIGTTDSEHAFCWMLDQIRKRFPKPPRNRKTLWRFVEKLMPDLNSLGIFNMLMSDGDALYTYCGTNLAWLTRKAPFGEATLIDAEMSVDFNEQTQPGDIVTVIATRPLTEKEDWVIMKPGTLSIFKQGLIVNA